MATKPYDVVRTTVDVASLFGERTVPAGSEGTVVEAKDDGVCLAEFELSPDAGDDEFVFQAVLAGGQYEIVRAA